MLEAAEVRLIVAEAPHPTGKSARRSDAHHRSSRRWSWGW
jgi:hypothetical protein